MTRFSDDRHVAQLRVLRSMDHGTTISNTWMGFTILACERGVGSFEEQIAMNYRASCPSSKMLLDDRIQFLRMIPPNTCTTYFRPSLGMAADSAHMFLEACQGWLLTPKSLRMYQAIKEDLRTFE